MVYSLLWVSPLAVKQDIAVTIFVRCMCMRVCMRLSVKICPGHTFMHGFQNNLAVVVLEEEKCHLKQFIF